MTPRIILATDSNEPSGLGEHMLTLGGALSATHDVVFAVPAHEAGSALLRRAANAGLAVKALDLEQPQLVRQWLSKQRGALLHVHAGIGWEGLDLVRYGKACGLPVVRTEHLPQVLTDPVQAAAYRAMALNLDGRIAVSETVRQSFAGYGRGPFAVVQNGVDLHTALSTKEATRAGLGIAADEKLLLTVARFTPQKAHATLVEAATAVVERFSKARFVFVGTGPDEEAVVDQVKRAGLEANFLFLGRREDVPNLLAAADLFVLPSLFEGLPLALLEAMAAKVPAVATTVGGSVEALGTDHTFLAQPGNAESLAQQILAALSDPEAARLTADAAHQRSRNRFSAQRMADETAAFYQTILPKQDARGSAA